jgi:hypothetical protein
MSLILVPRNCYKEPQGSNISSDYTFTDVSRLSTSMYICYILKGILISVELTCHKTVYSRFYPRQRLTFVPVIGLSLLRVLLWMDSYPSHFSRDCPECKRNVHRTFFATHEWPIFFSVVDVSFVQLQSCNLSVSYSDGRRIQCAGANRSGICLVMLTVWNCSI